MAVDQQDLFEHPVMKLSPDTERLAEMEKGLLQEVQERMSAWKKQDISVSLQSKDSMWKVSSALQKSIRRGYFDLACKYATALINGGQSYYFWNRLAVIALEDVGPGNMEAVARTLRMCRWKADRDKLDEVHLAQVLVYDLAASGKSRVLCDLICMRDLLKPEYGVAERSLNLEDWLPQLIEPPADPKELARLTYVAGRLMGDRSYEIDLQQANAGSGVSSPSVDPDLRIRNKIEFTQFCLENLDPLVWYVFTVAFKKSVFDLNVPLALYSAFGVSTEANWNDAVPTKPEMVEGVPDVAFDKHTADGKRAMAYVLKAHAPLRDFMEKVQPSDPFKAYGMMLFHVESSLLNVEVWNPVIESIRIRLEEMECMKVGLTPLVGDALKKLMRTPEHADALLYARRRVLGLL